MTTEAQVKGLELAATVLDERELASAVKRTLLINMGCKFLCQAHGPQPDCFCRGDDSRCHAHVLWYDEVHPVIIGLERAGVLK